MPCRLERMAIRAPMDAVVLDVDSRVTAGQVVATMFQTNGVDFGLVNKRIDHACTVPARYHAEYLHGENPIAQFAEPIRSSLLPKVNSLSPTPLGRLSYDVAATASGGWFLDGAPATGMVAIRLWNIGRDAQPNLAQPHQGTLLIQMLEANRLRMEWFNTQGPVAAFTAARRYSCDRSP